MSYSVRQTQLTIVLREQDYDAGMNTLSTNAESANVGLIDTRGEHSKFGDCETTGQRD